MKYNYCIDVRDKEDLRTGFNELTRKVFGFDFSDWYEKGQWGDKYIPHVLVDELGKVISNISVNLMKFNVGGEIKSYIQLGTVMTHPDYRGKGLNRYLLERILTEYREKVEGIYLFGNDSVLNYYPKFGFTPINQYQYSIRHEHKANIDKQVGHYLLEKVDLSNKRECDKIYDKIVSLDNKKLGENLNDSFCMCDNLGLYQFWLDAEFDQNVYYLPELESYVIAGIQSNVLTVYQVIGSNRVDMKILADSFVENIIKIELCFTPSDKELYDVKLYTEENCTLFILGNSLKNIEIEKMMFPIMSHA